MERKAARKRTFLVGAAAKERIIFGRSAVLPAVMVLEQNCGAISGIKKQILKNSYYYFFNSGK